MAKRRESVRLFESDFLERLSHVHPATPFIIWAPIVGLAFYRSMENGLPLPVIAGLGLSGLAFWTLAEYLLHRFAFHYEGKSQITKRLHFIIHGNHHDIPDDPTRLVMPPFASIVLGSAFYLLFRAVLGPTWAEAFFGGFIFGYLCYDYIHFSVHHFRPRTAIGRYLKQSHMIHHFVTPEARWGVSSPLWDVVFGTMNGERKPASARAARASSDDSIPSSAASLRTESLAPARQPSATVSNEHGA